MVIKPKGNDYLGIINDSMYICDMKIKYILLFLGAALCLGAPATVAAPKAPAAEKASSADKMAWWNEAKFGMFIHWGPYALYGGVYKGHKQRQSQAEWVMNYCKIPVLEYREMASHFNPTEFDADQFVRTAKEAGMKYLVFTSKHHDGFAMFRSSASAFNIVDWTPFGRDITDELVQACKRADFPFGFYYSHTQDWCNPGGTAWRRTMTRGWANPDSLMIDNYTLRHEGHWDGYQDARTFDEYLHEVSIPQMKELLDRYGKDMKYFFFDTPSLGIPTDTQVAEILELFKPYPQIIFNNRLKRPYDHGDFKTPEQKIPKPGDVKGIYWETCMTIGNSWGFKSGETQWKTPTFIVNSLVAIASLGGNFLLNVGPAPDGTLRWQETDCLKTVGAWMDRYGEAIYGTVRSGVEVPWGRVIRKDGAKSSTLYLCIDKWPADGSLLLPGSWKPSRAICLQDGSALRFTAGKDGVVLRLPAQAPAVSPAGTPVIVKLELRNLLPAEKLITYAEMCARQGERPDDH